MNRLCEFAAKARITSSAPMIKNMSNPRNASMETIRMLDGEGSRLALVPGAACSSLAWGSLSSTAFACTLSLCIDMALLSI
jgi:hypothetical protein